MQDHESSLILESSPAKSEGTGTIRFTLDEIDACRRKIKQLRKELKREERLMSEYRRQVNSLFDCDSGEEQDNQELSRFD